LTPGKNPAGPWTLETSDTALRIFPLVDSTVMGPNSPNPPPNSPRMSVLRKRPLDERTMDFVPITLPSARRAVIVMALSRESRLMTARNELNEAVRAEEGIRIFVAASSLCCWANPSDSPKAKRRPTITKLVFRFTDLLLSFKPSQVKQECVQCLPEP